MEVDEPFAEYVAARWSMLYRLAVLLVGETGADDLAQAALVAAYLSWADVREAPSADDHLKQILARNAARLPEQPPAGIVDPEVDTDPDRDHDTGAGDGHEERPPDRREHLWRR